jgi:hypothetical protein
MGTTIERVNLSGCVYSWFLPCCLEHWQIPHALSSPSVILSCVLPSWHQPPGKLVTRHQQGTSYCSINWMIELKLLPWDMAEVLCAPVM